MKLQPILTSAATVGAGLIVVAVLIALSTGEAAVSLSTFFYKPFSSWWYVGNSLNYAGLLILAAAGSAFAMRTGSFNLGGEAQIYGPALITAVMLSPIGPVFLPVPVRFGLTLLAAVVTGGLLGWLPGWLRSRGRISELLTSFLLSAALVPVLDHLISAPLRDQSRNLLATQAISEAFRLPHFVEPSYFNISFFASVILVVLAGLFLRNTRPGLRARLTGTAPEFTRFVGIPVAGVPILGMSVAGMFHGLTGFFSVTGTWYMCHRGFSAGMGWSALAIALIARQNVFAVLPAALFYAWLETASEAAILSTSFSFDSTAIVQGVIFLIITARFLPRIGKGGSQ